MLLTAATIASVVVSRTRSASGWPLTAAWSSRSGGSGPGGLSARRDLARTSDAVPSPAASRSIGACPGRGDFRARPCLTPDREQPLQVRLAACIPLLGVAAAAERPAAAMPEPGGKPDRECHHAQKRDQADERAEQPGQDGGRALHHRPGKDGLIVREIAPGIEVQPVAAEK